MPDSPEKRSVPSQRRQTERRTNQPTRPVRRRATSTHASKQAYPAHAARNEQPRQRAKYASRNTSQERFTAQTNRQRVERTRVNTDQARYVAPTNRQRQRSSSRGVQNTSPNKNATVVLAIILALVAILATAFAVNSCSSSSSSTENDDALAVSDATAPEAQTITLSFAGDCTLGTDENFDRSTSFTAKYEAVDDPSYFFANVADIFANDDATIVNMEGTLTTSTTRADKTFAFKAPAEYAQILVEGNVDAASLANNHSRDYGEVSYTDTIEAVENAGIPTFGYDRIAYLDVQGVKVALIGTYELAEGIGIKDEMVSNIETAKEAGAQVIAVYAHWGTERETVPDSVQMALAHAAIDAGATIVVGSHPHVIQGVEDYQGHSIVYSLGNFCFGGNKNPSDKDCMIFQATFTVQGNSTTTDSTTIIPCSISSSSSSNNYQPTPATGDEKTRIEAKIQTSSDAIANMAASLSE